MRPLDSFVRGLEAALREVAAAGLLRRAKLPSGIDMASNDYLGLAQHAALVEAMRGALPAAGAGAGGSRLLRGHRLLFEEIEERLASFCGAPAALLFGSGYAANVGLLQALLGEDDLVLSDERNHASLIDGLRLSPARRLIYPHQDLAFVDDALRKPRRGRAVVVTESIFSMDGDHTPLAELLGIAEERGAVLVVDESHATGLYGARGSGRVEALGLRERVLATVHTGGKALGSGGAWVAGPRALREVLFNRARTFMFSTAPLPVLPAALHAALDCLRSEPQRMAEVHRKAALLRSALAQAGVRAGGDGAILPIHAGSAEDALALEAGLLASGFDARAVRPPTVPPGTSRLRVTVRYPVPDADLLRFASEVARLLPSRAA